MEFMVLFQSMFFALSAIKYKSGMCIFSYDYWVSYQGLLFSRLPIYYRSDENKQTKVK